MTPEQFAQFFPGLKITLYDHYRLAIEIACEEFSIAGFRRKAAFLAQIGHETGGLRWLEELGGPGYFARYDGRADLGNTQPGDGNKYHGRGLIQLTGRANYREFGMRLGLPLEDEPERALDIRVGARIAGLYWKSRGCNELAEQDRFLDITRKINGGLNGLEDRLRRWDKARALFGLAAIREQA